MSPAITTSAGRDVLWSEEVHGYRLKVIHSSSTAANLPTNSHSSKAVDISDQIKNKSTPIAKQFENFQNKYQKICVDEDYDKKRK